MKNIQIILLFFVFGCTTNKNIDISYSSISNQTDKDIKYEKWYYENTPEEYYRHDDETLILFSGQAFKNSEIVINKKDTLIFKEESKPLECLGFKMYIIKKNNKFLNVESDKKNERLRLKLENNYNYVIIGDSFNNNHWGVKYYPFFPNIACR